MISAKQAVRRVAGNLGYELRRRDAQYAGMDAAFWPIYRATADYSAGSRERLYALYKAVEWVVKAKVAGVFVECGVLLGGSSMAAALSLLHYGDTSRDLWLYDTFTAAWHPTEKDISYLGVDAGKEWESRRDQYIANPPTSLARVQANMRQTGYPVERIHYVEGKVEETIPGAMPTEIAILRLDTDWYESTYHEMVHLFPLLTPRGVLLLDDYGHWKGVREAVDRYLAETGTTILLNRIDDAGVIGIKV